MRKFGGVDGTSIDSIVEAEFFTQPKPRPSLKKSSLNFLKSVFVVILCAFLIWLFSFLYLKLTGITPIY